LLFANGIGVHAIAHFQKEHWPDQVDLLDGGTGGFQLLHLFQEYDRILLIDAILDGREPGTIAVLEPRFASDFPRGLSSHDIGLRDLLEAASLIGSLPQLVLVTISIGNIQAMKTELSPELESRLAAVLETVKPLVSQA
jgi:hydrogenase maturation protease